MVLYIENCLGTLHIAFAVVQQSDYFNWRSAQGCRRALDIERRVSGYTLEQLSYVSEERTGCGVLSTTYSKLDVRRGGYNTITDDIMIACSNTLSIFDDFNGIFQQHKTRIQQIKIQNKQKYVTMKTIQLLQRSSLVKVWKRQATRSCLQSTLHVDDGLRQCAVKLQDTRNAQGN